jgi:hypothetical protein
MDPVTYDAVTALLAQEAVKAEEDIIPAPNPLMSVACRVTAPVLVLKDVTPPLSA